MEGSGDSSEEQFRRITSDAYFTSINVEATLKLLQDLAFQKTTNKALLEEENKHEYEIISENITELARQRDELHKLLEVETIKANKRRRDLQVLPKLYNKHMHESVVAARRQNADKIMSLQEKLKSLKGEVNFIERKMEELNVENIKLKPDCEVIRKEHDQIIAQLNHRMSVKSSKQIVLNETCDTLRDVQRQTAEIDLGLENLAEDLAKDKEEAAAIRSELINETKETEVQIADMKGKIDEEKRGLNVMMEQQTEKSVEIQEKRKVINRVENSVMRLEMDTLQLNQKIDREKRSNQETLKEIETLTEVKSKESLVYQEKIESIQKKLDQAMVECGSVEGEHQEMINRKKETKAKLIEIQQRKTKLSQEVKDSAKELERLKEAVSQRIEESGNISLMNNTIQEKLTDLDENHRATVELYQTQTDELTEHLNKEKGERVKVQLKREESQKHLENFRGEETKFMNQISSKINLATSEHQKLSEESLLLSRDTKRKKKYIETLEVKLEVAQGGLRSMKMNMEQDLERLRKSVESLVQDVEKKRQIEAEKVPQLEELKQNSEDLNAEYSDGKAKMMAIRNQEKSLNEQKSRTKVMVDKIRRAINELKFKTEEIRRKCIEQLKKENEDRDKAEEDINLIIGQMEIIFNSNEHFRKAREKVSTDYDALVTGMKTYSSQQQMLLKQFRETQRLFAESWAITVDMEQASADHDAQLLEDMRRIQRDTKERVSLLSKIADEMEQDLAVLADFTENVSSRRPKDTRQSKRGSRRRPRGHVPPSRKEVHIVRPKAVGRPHSSQIYRSSPREIENKKDFMSAELRPRTHSFNTRHDAVNPLAKQAFVIETPIAPNHSMPKSAGNPLQAV